MKTEEGRAPCQEKPGPRARKRNGYRYTSRTPKSTFCGCDFTVRAALVLVAFAAWIAAIVGAFFVIAYGTVRAVAAMTGTDPDTLRALGLFIFFGLIVACAFGALYYRERG